MYYHQVEELIQRAVDSAEQPKELALAAIAAAILYATNNTSLSINLDLGYGIHPIPIDGTLEVHHKEI